MVQMIKRNHQTLRGIIPFPNNEQYRTEVHTNEVNISTFTDHIIVIIIEVLSIRAPCLFDCTLFRLRPIGLDKVSRNNQDASESQQ
jgi:hypothetical protein